MEASFWEKLAEGGGGPAGERAQGGGLGMLDRVRARGHGLRGMRRLSLTRGGERGKLDPRTGGGEGGAFLAAINGCRCSVQSLTWGGLVRGTVVGASMGAPAL